MQPKLTLLLALLPLALSACSDKKGAGGDNPALKAKVGIIKSPSVEEFDKLLAESSIVFVDFQADWCGPCRMMAPVVHDIEKTYRGRITFVEVDVDRVPELADRYNVSSIPRFQFFRGGREVDRIVGACDRSQLVRILEREIDNVK